MTPDRRSAFDVGTRAEGKPCLLGRPTGAQLRTVRRIFRTVVLRMRIASSITARTRGRCPVAPGSAVPGSSCRGRGMTAIVAFGFLGAGEISPMMLKSSDRVVP